MRNEMNIYKNLNYEVEIFADKLNFKDKIIVDVGCGEGKLTREIAKSCNIIYGIDLKEIIDKAKKYDNLDNINFLYGLGQNMPIEDNLVDIAIFFKSFHHIPKEQMYYAIKESDRILKNKGVVCFVEPLSIMGSYYDFSRLVNDEAEILSYSYQIIKNIENNGFNLIDESCYSINKKYSDFENQVNTYVKDEVRREIIFENAKKLVEQKKETIDKVNIISYLRINMYEKK